MDYDDKLHISSLKRKFSAVLIKVLVTNICVFAAYFEKKNEKGLFKSSAKFGKGSKTEKLLTQK